MKSLQLSKCHRYLLSRSNELRAPYRHTDVLILGSPQFCRWINCRGLETLGKEPESQANEGWWQEESNPIEQSYTAPPLIEYDVRTRILNQETFAEKYKTSNQHSRAFHVVSNESVSHLKTQSRQDSDLSRHNKGKKFYFSFFGCKKISGII